MKRTLLLLALCTAAFAADPPPKFTPEPAAKATPRDAAVIDAALADLLADKKALILTNEPGRTIFLLNSETDGPIDEPQLDGDFVSDKWKIPADIRADMKRRNTAAASLKELKFAKTITVQPLKEIDLSFEALILPDGKFQNVKGYASTHLPSYSADGTQAVLRFGFGPTAHGATATYLLILKDGKWTVKERNRAYYL